jgi:DNA replicative helicase MCM subunit Mcm2 (Cdc46/Mcm family)
MEKGIEEESEKMEMKEIIEKSLEIKLDNLGSFEKDFVKGYKVTEKDFSVKLSDIIHDFDKEKFTTKNLFLDKIEHNNERIFKTEQFQTLNSVFIAMFSHPMLRYAFFCNF